MMHYLIATQYSEMMQYTITTQDSKLMQYPITTQYSDMMQYQMTARYSEMMHYPIPAQYSEMVQYQIRVITKLPNSEQSYKGKVKTHNYISRQNQSTTGKLKTVMTLTWYRHFKRNGGLNQILRRQTSRSHYGSKVPAVIDSTSIL